MREHRSREHPWGVATLVGVPVDQAWSPRHERVLAFVGGDTVLLPVDVEAADELVGSGAARAVVAVVHTDVGLGAN